MLLEEREHIILRNINSNGTATVRQLAQACNVTEVTVRRDLKRLEENKLLKRVFGGAVSIERSQYQTPQYTAPAPEAPDLPNADALIMTTIDTRDAHTLRERAIRQDIPLIAEGNPQDGAVYLGIDNYETGHQLGQWSANYFRRHSSGSVHVLDIGVQSMSATRKRSKGFLDGLSASIGDEVAALSIDGKGRYDSAYHMALDALRLHPEINLIFGINDDSILAGMQAYHDLGRDKSMLIAVSIGAEGNTIFDALMGKGPLKACMAMFPEVVGRLAIDTVRHLWRANRNDFNVITPTALLTAENINEFYVKNENHWQFINEEIVKAVALPWNAEDLCQAEARKRRISFSISFRTHEWYQNLAKAMHARAKSVGVEFSVVDVNEDIRQEIRELQRIIGKLAASYIREGETIILDAGTTTMNMTQFLKQRQNITVITNSPDIFAGLRPNPSIKLILAGGAFDREAQAFVGRQVHALFKEMRVDKAFIVAEGFSSSFGLSAQNSNVAEVRRSMIDAAREVVALADHTLLGFDSDVHVTNFVNVDTMITDMGALPSQRLEYAQSGKNILVAGQVPAADE